ncbi:MAG: hypothetical protein ABIP93_12500 [Gemmatimonadaceae bacterium]
MPLSDFSFRAANRTDLDGAQRTDQYVSPVAYTPGAVQGDAAPDDQLSAILGEATRTGPWVLPPLLDVQVVLGEVLIDLRDAVLPPVGCEIALFGLLGAFKLLVPQGVVVVDELTSLGSTVRNDAAHDGVRMIRTTRVRLTGTAVMSEVEVRVAASGESARRAWKQAKRKGRRE